MHLLSIVLYACYPQIQKSPGFFCLPGDFSDNLRHLTTAANSQPAQCQQAQRDRAGLRDCTNDVVSKWEGDPDNKDGWGEYIAVPRAVAYWAAVNRCTHEICEELPLINNKVIAHRYVDGIGGNQVWLYEVVGGSHAWADKDMNPAAEIWKFFSMYLK